MRKASAEYKYIFIKSVKSGRTLTEAKSLARAVTVGLTDEYANAKQKQSLLGIEGTLNRITMTRGRAADLMKIRFGPRKNYPSTREEILAKWASGYRGALPLDWTRDGNLVRRGPPNKPRPGSSREVVDPQSTRIIGAERVEKDFRLLITTLQKLQKRHGRQNTAMLRKAMKDIRASASAYS